MLFRSVRTDTGDADAVAELQLASGAAVELSSRWSADENFLEIVGTNGVLRSREWWGREFAGHLEIEQSGATEQVPLRRANVYDAQLSHLSDAASGRCAPLTSARRGAANIAVIEAVVRSARSGEPAPVTAPSGWLG